VLNSGRKRVVAQAASTGSAIYSPTGTAMAPTTANRQTRATIHQRKAHEFVPMQRLQHPVLTQHNKRCLRRQMPHVSNHSTPRMPGQCLPLVFLTAEPRSQDAAAAPSAHNTNRVPAHHSAQEAICARTAAVTTTCHTPGCRHGQQPKTRHCPTQTCAPAVPCKFKEQSSERRHFLE
jgi:hypothetical protein